MRTILHCKEVLEVVQVKMGLKASSLVFKLVMMMHPKRFSASSSDDVILSEFGDGAAAASMS